MTISVFKLSDIEYLKENYATLGPAVCALAVGLSKKQVSHKADKLGLRVSAETKFKIRRLARRNVYYQHKVDAEQFKSVKTPEAAYILGLLWADGFLSNDERMIGLIVQERDGRVYESIFKKTGSWGVYWSKARKHGWQNQIHIHTSNRPLSTYLKDHDYRSKSSSPDKILSVIPENLKSYWFRGLMDGDGHIGFDEKFKVYRCCVCSCFDQDWKYMIDICSRLGIGYRVRYRNRPKSKASTFAFTSRVEMLTFLDFVYRDREIDGIGLDRKYSKYLIIKDRQIKSKPFPKYTGVGYRAYNHFGLWKWKASIPNRYHPPQDDSFVGYFDSEEEAFEAQQEKIKRLGLVEIKRTYGK